MLIGIRVEKSPRRKLYCEACGQPMRAGDLRLRLYGMAHRGDQPYAIWVHARAECVGADWSRVQAKLDEAKKTPDAAARLAETEQQQWDRVHWGGDEP